MKIELVTGDVHYADFAQAVCDMIIESAKARGTGIAKRKPEYVREKISKGNAVLAFVDGKMAGFCYIESWSHGRYVANSGLIVSPDFRRLGLAKMIKTAIFRLSREKYPEAKVFGITTSLPVMKINSSLGYEPVTFGELTQDEAFWQGCASCPNHDILLRNDRRMCLCTAMLAPSAAEVKKMAVDLSDQIIKLD
jgi:GNAT superfamily N-acetyltransferase